MKRIATGAALLLLTLPLAGCIGQWESLEKGSGYNYKDGASARLAFRDAATFSFFYHWMHPGNTGVPAVDFDNNNVVAAYLGGQRNNGGYQVGVTDVTYNEIFQPRYRVHVEDIPPSPFGPVTMSITRPYELIQLGALPTDEIGFIINGATVVTANEPTLKDLIEQDLMARTSAAPTSSGSEVTSLLQGICPINGEKVVVVLNVQPGITAHFCPKHGLYWLRTKTVPVGTPPWFGPLAPGVY